jgi:N,N'-diacetyllegionaminate synthase
LGDGVKAPSPDEIEMAALVRRSWHAARDLDAGHRLSEEDICLKRPAAGLAPDKSPLGSQLAVACPADAPIREVDLAGGRVS